MGLFLAFVEVSMGGRNASGSERERAREGEGERAREPECVKMTEEVWANTDAKPCVCFLACSEQLNEAGRQVSAKQREGLFS